mgnify:FL=1
MANQIKAPYNFVPINHEVYIPSWGKQISMDVPFSDGEDGLIEVELQNNTPLFIRNGAGASACDKEEYSAHITLPNGEKRYFLPGSSLKGMLRSVMEILAFARLKEDSYNDDFFGFRRFGGNNDPLQTEYIKQMNEGVCCGWLRYDYKRDEYLLDDCGIFDSNTCRISIETLREVYPRYKNVEDMNALDKNDVLGYPDIDGRTLVCTGKMKSKKHEYLFDKVKNEDIHVDSDVIVKFKTVYKPSDYKDNLYKKLNKGERIAVFFKKDNHGKVSVIGLTRNFRYPYKYRISDCIVQPNVGEGPDLVDCIFGYVNKEDALKGRVHVGNAFANETVIEDNMVKGVLGQPSASYYPLYLRQVNEGKYTTYNDEAEMAGRKRYRVHAPNALTDPKYNGNENVVTEMKPLPAGTTFKLLISVHNLRPIEVGALLSALTFHGTEGPCHNIGQGKSFGFGSLRIKKLELKNFKYDEHAYLKDFEWEMSKFYDSNHPGELWANSDIVKTLLSIAAEHANADELELMNLQGYKDYRKNDKYSTLKEATVNAKAFVDIRDVLKARADVKRQAEARAKAENEANAQIKADVIEQSLKALKQKEQCETANDCSVCDAILAQAIDDYETLKKEYGISSYGERIETLRNLKSEYLQYKIMLLSKVVNTSVKASSFEEHIGKAFTIGTLSGKLDKWEKTKGESQLDAEDLEILHKHIVNKLPKDKAYKKEKKEWLTFDLQKARGWKSLSAYVSADVLQTWYEEMTKGNA